MASASEEILTPISAETPVAVASSTATTKDFSHSILEKLKKSNYLLRCQQVEPAIKRHRLHYLLTNPQIPLRYATLADRDAGKTSPEFLL